MIYQDGHITKGTRVYTTVEMQRRVDNGIWQIAKHQNPFFIVDEVIPDGSTSITWDMVREMWSNVERIGGPR